MAVTMGQFPHKWRRLTDRCGSTDNTIDGACEHQGSFKENRNKETYIDIQEENVKLFRIHNEEKKPREGVMKGSQAEGNLLNKFVWMDGRRKTKNDGDRQRFIWPTKDRKPWQPMSWNNLAHKRKKGATTL